MSTHNKQLIISAAIAGFGFHPGAPHTQAARLTQVAYYRQLLQAAEQGLLDFVLLQDGRSLPADLSLGRLDALSLLSRLAPETQRIGLAVSKPTTYSEPFTVSRELATLDFVSGGRAAWQPTTNATDLEAFNYSRPHAPNAEQRRAMATEFVEVSRKLWDSWEDDAVIADRERGLYLDPAKLHHINHVGEHFRIRGPQITYRPPQGHVVVVQVDEGDAGAPLSPLVADVLVLHHTTLHAAQRAYARLHDQAATAGRTVRILQSILPVLGETEAFAQQRAAQLDAVAAGRNGKAVTPYAQRFVGTPQQFADFAQQWVEAGAADGFHLLPAVLPDGLYELTHKVVPELQARGIFRHAYAGPTLREQLGLPRPTSQYATVAA
ncbi:MAG: LLM class flavin-dependent oxidoreductase [Caldilineaceae bacterium]|nr:LLM class flavin-dependent oxidoreductase [Caldilineaceae bacterium]